MMEERKEILKKHLPNVTDLWISINEGLLDAMEEYANQVRKEAIDEAQIMRGALENINAIMWNSFMIRGVPFGSVEGKKIMDELEKWAES